MKTLSHYITYSLFRSITALTRPVPRKAFERFILFLLKASRYRSRVILENLTLAFPNLTPAELKSLLQGYYAHLAQVITEILRPAAVKVTYKNVDLVNNSKAKDGVILLAAHINNWEAIGRQLGPHLDLPGYGVFKQLSNKLFEEYLIHKRAGKNATPIPVSKLLRTIISLKKKSQKAVYLLIADQSPTHKNKEVNFLGVPTYFIDGPEKINEKFDFDFFYMYSLEESKSQYNVEFIHVKGNKITEAYSLLLEDNIKKQPTNWLWSHNRWKLNKKNKA